MEELRHAWGELKETKAYAISLFYRRQYMKDRYAALKQFFKKIDTVVVNDGKGAQGIKHAGKMFAMFYKGDLTLKFSPERVTELIESGKGTPHDPGTGKPMKDRILIPGSKSQTWIELTKESLEYVSKN